MTDKTTPFIEHHRAAGAKIVPFAGFLMPLQYAGIRAEHDAVRNRVGLFDVSHMGEFWIRGKDAVGFADRLVTNHVATAAPGQVVYTPLLQEDGGIVDDCLVYRFEDKVLFVVNAANIAGDWDHIRAQAPDGVEMENVSAEMGLLALQGPNAVDLMRGLVPEEALRTRVLPVSWRSSCSTCESSSLVRVTRERTASRSTCRPTWPIVFGRASCGAGRSSASAPCGLGARDVLRLEMGYCLYGNDIDRTIHPLEAGLGWTVKLDKQEFHGSGIPSSFQGRGPQAKARGFFAQRVRESPRHEMEIHQSGSRIGTVTSGGYSPSIDGGVGLGFVPLDQSKSGTEITIHTGRADIAATVARPPFAETAHHSKKKKAPKPSEA